MSSTPTTISGSASDCTEVIAEHFTYEWVIKNFKLLPQGKKEISSPIFHTVTNEAEWKLGIFPYGKDGKALGYVSVYLDLHSHNARTTEIGVYAEFSILPSGILRKFVGIQKYQNQEAYGFHNMIKRSELLDLCGSDDTVTIRCKITIPTETMSKPIDRTECIEPAFESQGGQMCQDYRRLFQELPKLSDFTVIVGPKEFPAHKVVLATRSPVFSAMFENEETIENINNEVKIERMEPAVVEAMLEFFYTDEVTNLEELAYGLLEAADKYDVQRLRSMCEKVLHKALNKENAAEILVLANLHRSYQLKKYVMKFIADHFSDVEESESYKEIEDSKLLKELMHSVVARKSPRK